MIKSFEKFGSREGEVERKMRNSAPFLRLKERIADKGCSYTEEGFGSEDLCFGEIVDIGLLYVNAAGSGRDSLEENLKKLAEDQLPADIQREAEVLIAKLLELKDDEINQDVYNYKCRIKDGMELTHYPGGLMIKKRLRSDGLDFMLVNRQQQDNGIGYIKNIFRDLGLAVKSNIVH